MKGTALGTQCIKIAINIEKNGIFKKIMRKKKLPKLNFKQA